MSELVSIIMPNFNCSGYLAATIDSVLAQTYSNWELLFVDDNSTDNSLKIIEKYAKNDSRFVILRNKGNMGAAYSRNLALKMARGRWIAFLDSDDIWLPQKLDEQISFMDNNGIAFSYSNYGTINQDGINLHLYFTGPKVVTKKMLHRCCYMGCLTVMYDSNVIGRLSIPDNIYKRNDYALWLKAITKSDCWLFNRVLAFHRKRENSLSNVNKLKLIKSHYRLFRISEGASVLKSIYFSAINVFYFLIKKSKYAFRDLR